MIAQENPFVFDSEDTPYLKHHFQEKCWYRGKERIDANYFMIDPGSMLMGWGKYTSGEGYSYVWQKDLFSSVARPDEEYKKAFDEALKNGVKILCYDCKLSNEEIRINNQINYEK